ncbi:MAG: T9SS type A sorting domain-containing protein [Chitinophagaceae bacterium]
MQKIIQYGLLLVACTGAFLQHAMAQTTIPQPLAPRPSVWFSFDVFGVFGMGANIGSASAFAKDEYSLFTTSDRFGISGKAIDLTSNRQSAMKITGPSQYNARKLFGYNETIFPSDFTIACWVYVQPSSITYTHKIFYSDEDNSRFALLHKGSDIYLRRVATDKNGVEQRFDYLFGAPASFDAGTGWYLVVLVMGMRNSDNAPYTKLYIGKPGYIKYDATGPRVVTNTDPLASNFGGSYAFLGVQPFMQNITNGWGLGNWDDNDPVYGTNIVAAHRIDDFTVWDVALDDMQAYRLFMCQKDNPASSCWVSATGTSSRKPAQQPGADSVATANALSVYPNPTNGELSVTIPQGTGGTVSCQLLDLGGKLLFTQTAIVGKQGQVLQLSNLKKAAPLPGMYLLKVVTPAQTKTFKVVIQ